MGRLPAVLGLPGLLALNTACGSGDTCDTAVDVCGSEESSASFKGSVFIDDIRWSCCDPESNPACEQGWFWYDVFTEGVPAVTSLTILEAGIDRVWSESHSLPSVDRDPDRYWDDRYLELAVVDTSDCLRLDDCSPAFKPGETTLFPCRDTWLDTRITWAVTASPSVTGEGAHCVVWGADPSEFPDCEAWTVEQ